MIGSEKQIKWATDIQTAAVSQFHELGEKFAAAGRADAAAAIAAIADKIASVTNSRWLIDNRDRLANFKPTRAGDMSAYPGNEWAFIMNNLRAHIVGSGVPGLGLGMKPEVTVAYNAAFDLAEI